MGEAGANQMAMLREPGLRAEASALAGGREQVQSQDEETLLDSPPGLRKLEGVPP